MAILPIGLADKPATPEISGDDLVISQSRWYSPDGRRLREKLYLKIMSSGILISR